MGITHFRAEENEQFPYFKNKNNFMTLEMHNQNINLIFREHRRQFIEFEYSGIRIKSTPQDRKKLLTLSKIDFIQFQGRKPKFY